MPAQAQEAWADLFRALSSACMQDGCVEEVRHASEPITMTCDSEVCAARRTAERAAGRGERSCGAVLAAAGPVRGATTGVRGAAPVAAAPRCLSVSVARSVRTSLVVLLAAIRVLCCASVARLRPYAGASTRC